MPSGQNISDIGDDSSKASPKSSFNSDVGTEAKNINNWITVNHDIYGTRNSNQTVINKDNVAMLQVKWQLLNDIEIQ